MSTPDHLRQSPTCTVDGCDKPSAARSLCAKHYKRWERRGDPEPEMLRSPNGTRTKCRLDGCDRPRGHPDGWCQMHGARVTKTGDPGPVGTLASVKPKTCTVGTCQEPVQQRGLCKTHYSRWRRHGDPTHVVPRRPRQRPPCSHPGGCDKPAASRGLCTNHYAHWRRHASFAELAAAGIVVGKCAVKVCIRPATGARGMCDSHYTAYRARIRRAQAERAVAS